MAEGTTLYNNIGSALSDIRFEVGVGLLDWNENWSVDLAMFN